MFLKVCFPVRRGPPLLQRAGVPRGRSRTGPQQDSFASTIIEIAEN